VLHVDRLKIVPARNSERARIGMNGSRTLSSGAGIRDRMAGGCSAPQF
jgi:hypothetical protein